MGRVAQVLQNERVWWSQNGNGGSNKGKGRTRGRVAAEALLLLPARGAAKGRCDRDGWKRLSEALLSDLTLTPEVQVQLFPFCIWHIISA